MAYEEFEDEGWERYDGDLAGPIRPVSYVYPDLVFSAYVYPNRDTDQYCQTCKGEGELTDYVGGFMALYTCPVCHGVTISLKEMAQRERDAKEAA